MNVQVRTWMTDSQRQNPCSQFLHWKPQSESKRLDQNSSRAVAKPTGEAQHHGIAQYSARTETDLAESAGESGTNTTATTTVTCSGQCWMHE